MVNTLTLSLRKLKRFETKGSNILPLSFSRNQYPVTLLTTRLRTFHELSVLNELYLINNNHNNNRSIQVFRYQCIRLILPYLSTSSYLPPEEIVCGYRVRPPGSKRLSRHDCLTVPKRKERSMFEYPRPFGDHSGFTEGRVLTPNTKNLCDTGGGICFKTDIRQEGNYHRCLRKRSSILT